MKLLLAEDEKRMAEALGEILALEGYDVDLAADGEEALAAARRGVYDILVLDVMMPKINSFELTARLRALTRRKEDYHRNLLSYGDIVLNPSTAELICKRSGQSVRLSRKEYRILEYMIANQGLILSREQLAVKIWGYDSEAEYNNADLLERQEGENRWLSNIIYENDRMGQLVKDLLDLSRAGSDARPFEEIDFSRLVDQELLPFESMAFEHGLIIDSKVQEGIRVKGDPQRLGQFLSILIDNAISHSTGGGEIHILLKKKGKAGLTFSYKSQGGD